jgi:AcrR family transcriptional regulator
VTTPEGRPLRADARRNRERLLEAAEEVFATAGASAPTGDIARRAGVGIGTLFRHFPTKAALVEAIVLNRMERLVDEADTLVATGDPATAFFTLFERTVEEAGAKKAYSELLAEGLAGVVAAAPGLSPRLMQRIGTLLTRAQEAGTARVDVGVAEIVALLVGALRAAEHAGDDAELRVRTVGVLLDGVRPGGREPT